MKIEWRKNFKKSHTKREKQFIYRKNLRFFKNELLKIKNILNRTRLILKSIKKYL